MCAAGTNLLDRSEEKANQKAKGKRQKSKVFQFVKSALPRRTGRIFALCLLLLPFDLFLGGDV